MRKTILKPIFDTVRLWYIPLIIGILFILASIFAFVFPWASFITLALFFSLSFLLSGLSEIVFSVSNKKTLDNWGWHLALGIITLVIGLLLIINPEISAGVLALYIGFTILFRSIANISFSIDIKNFGIRNWGYLLALGILGTVVSVILIINPVLAGVSTIIIMAIAFLIIGILSILFSMQLKRVQRYVKKINPDIKERYRKFQREIIEEISEAFND